MGCPEDVFARHSNNDAKVSEAERSEPFNDFWFEFPDEFAFKSDVERLKPEAARWKNNVIPLKMPKYEFVSRCPKPKPGKQRMIPSPKTDNDDRKVSEAEPFNDLLDFKSFQQKAARPKKYMCGQCYTPLDSDQKCKGILCQGADRDLNFQTR